MEELAQCASSLSSDVDCKWAGTELMTVAERATSDYIWNPQTAKGDYEDPAFELLVITARIEDILNAHATYLNSQQTDRDALAWCRAALAGAQHMEEARQVLLTLADDRLWGYEVNVRVGELTVEPILDLCAEGLG